MRFAHDPDMDFYYYGEVQPYPGMLREMLWDVKRIIIDTETISLKERIATGIGITGQKNCCFYFPLFPNTSPAVPWHLLKDPSVEKVAHNAPFDLLSMREYDINNENILDTSSMGRLMGYKYNDLSSLSGIQRMRNGEGVVSRHMGDLMKEYNTKTTLTIPVEEVAKKCCEDCMATGYILDWLTPMLQSYNWDAFVCDMELMPVLIEMSFRGLLIDHDVRLSLIDEFEAEANQYVEICKQEGFKISSPQQVAHVLADRGAYRVFRRLPYTNRKKNQLSSDKETLKAMHDPLANMILRYREISYLLSHYVYPLAGEDRAYTRFHLDAATGRPSSTDRNMMNIPKGRARNMYLPDSGIFTDVDYSQAELRLLSHISGDREMQHIFAQPKFLPNGEENPAADLHQQTADFLGIARRPAKNVNFALVYGATADTIMETAGTKNIQQAQELMDRWGRLFPEAWSWINDMQEQAEHSNIATTVFGRKLRLPDAEDEGLAAVKRKAVNYPIQGSAAELLKRSLIKCRSLGMDMALQVHDEILFDQSVSYEELKWMEEVVPGLHTPIDIKYLERWQ